MYLRFVKSYKCLNLYRIMPLLPDDLDFFIIKKYLSNKKIGKAEIVKNFKWNNYPPFFVNKYHEQKFYDKKINVISNRLKRMENEGLLKMNGSKKYAKKEPIFNEERILLEKHKFPDGRKDAILIKNKENKWDIFQI